VYEVNARGAVFGMTEDEVAFMLHLKSSTVQESVRSSLAKIARELKFTMQAGI